MSDALPRRLLATVKSSTPTRARRRRRRRPRPREGSGGRFPAERPLGRDQLVVVAERVGARLEAELDSPHGDVAPDSLADTDARPAAGGLTVALGPPVRPSAQPGQDVLMMTVTLVVKNSRAPSPC